MAADLCRSFDKAIGALKEAKYKSQTCFKKALISRFCLTISAKQRNLCTKKQAQTGTASGPWGLRPGGLV